MIVDPLMIGRMAVRPGIGMESHRLIKTQPFMGDFAGERIDFQNGQRRARQDLRQQLFAITARTQGVVNRQMFDIAITGKLPAAAQANKSPSSNHASNA